MRGWVWFDWLRSWRLQRSFGKPASVGATQMESHVGTLVWPPSWRLEMRLALEMRRETNGVWSACVSILIQAYSSILHESHQVLCSSDLSSD